MTNDAVIVDVDGTLVNVMSIRHLVTGETRNFNAFHRESVNCPPNQKVIDAIKAHRDAGLKIIIVTARQFQYLRLTVWWMHFAGVGDIDAIYMRRDGDYRPDAEVKAGILRMIKDDGFNPIIAYDDRPCVAEVWKSHGIPTVMVDELGNLGV
jgi:hypothetical protein